jgi:hypothetical protein
VSPQPETTGLPPTLALSASSKGDVPSYASPPARQKIATRASCEKERMEVVTLLGAAAAHSDGKLQQLFGTAQQDARALVVARSPLRP